jgi:hypothetical protein
MHTCKTCTHTHIRTNTHIHTQFTKTNTLKLACAQALSHNKNVLNPHTNKKDANEHVGIACALTDKQNTLMMS